MVSEKRLIPRIRGIILSCNHINQRSLGRLGTHSESDHMSLTSAGDKLSFDSPQVCSDKLTSRTPILGAFGFAAGLSRHAVGQKHR